MRTGSRSCRAAARCTLVAGLAGALSACATTQARIDQFETFAVAGVGFADAVPAVLDESFESTVETSSLVLREARPLLDQDTRLAELETQDSLLTERLAILTDIKRHARAVRAYFVALQTLAQSSAESSGLTDVTRGVLERLGGLSPTIRTATVGGMEIGQLVAPAVELTVGQFRSIALEDELRRHATALERELALQQAALEAVAEAMRADLDAQAAAEDRDRIYLPYARSGALPADWGQRRLDSFRRQTRLTSVEAAAQAAETLRSSFVALVEGGLGDALLGALVQDVTAILTFTQSMAEGS
jgi:hypothetical protein